MFEYFGICFWAQRQLAMLAVVAIIAFVFSRLWLWFWSGLPGKRNPQLLKEAFGFLLVNLVGLAITLAIVKFGSEDPGRSCAQIRERASPGLFPILRG